MARPDRLAVVHAALLVFGGALLVRAAYVQVWDGDRWRVRAARQHAAIAATPAPRGSILDADGVVLVESRSLMRLRVGPRDLVHPRSVAVTAARIAALRDSLRALGVAPEWVSRATDTTRRWVELPGRFLPADARRATASRAVRAVPVAERVAPASEGLRRVIGVADGDGMGVDGLERSLDSLLRGAPGRATVFRDHVGRPLASRSGDAPVPGHTVVLTIRRGLQDIAERALADAVADAGASGGDVVVLDVESGAILALASQRSGSVLAGAAALTEPVEPGSTLKPFIAAALLDRGRARVDEVIPTYNGVLTRHGRTIHDVHRAAALTLGEVIRHSSNVGIVQFAERLTPREQYEVLRDLGFGTPTGIPYPNEAAGRLTRPALWSRQSPASLAMGYEIAVTPLQLAVAYAAIANGGELRQPALVQEVRAPDGTVRWRHIPRTLRRVMTPETAATVRALLQEVVSGGTARSADLATFDVAGKSGTARRVEGGRYRAGAYTATFAGLFPAQAPQVVVVVKLDNPSGPYFGGRVAAPVTRAVLQGALAAADAPLDRARLASLAARPIAAPAATVPEPPPPSIAAGSAAPPSGAVPFVVTLPGARSRGRDVVLRRPVPDVRGLPLRAAVRVLHDAGFRVRVAPGVVGSDPAAGTIAPAGTVVRVAGGP